MNRLSNNMLEKVLLFLSLFGSLRQDLIRTCPPAADIPQCSCKQSVNFRIICKELYNPWDLKVIAATLSKYDVYQLRLDDSYLMYWPKEMFSQLHLKEIEIYNSEILGVESDNGTLMFQGLENSLRRLYFYNVTGMDAWRWSAFTILQGLKTFIIRRGDLTSIKKDFSSISPESLSTVHLGYNKINYIQNSSFANHVALEEWELEGNEIADISRDMLPKPASQLRTIHLFENKIVTIPNDFFTEMPKLKYVFLAWNRIKFLSQEMFLPLQNGQQFLLDIRYNNIFCCSTTKFLVKAEYRECIMGGCMYPQGLKDKEIRTLTESDMDHGFC